MEGTCILHIHIECKHNAQQWPRSSKPKCNEPYGEITNRPKGIITSFAWCLMG